MSRQPRPDRATDTDGEARPSMADPADAMDPADDETSEQLSLISLPTAASIAGVLALIAAWAAVILVGGGLWLLGRTAAGDAAEAMSASQGASIALGSAVPILPLALAASLTFASVVLAMIVTWVRPLRSLVRSTTQLIQGQWHRPIPQNLAAIAPVQQLAGIYEDLRGSLVDRLRSSTELNLQLESEVARRTAELERRNADLAALLARLESTRSEILRNEKLATVGRIAADVAFSLRAPMTVLQTVPPRLSGAFDAIAQASADPRSSPGDRPVERSLSQTLRDMDAWLVAVIESATQVSRVVRTLRVYARPGLEPASAASKPMWGSSGDPVGDEKADPSPSRLPPA